MKKPFFLWKYEKYFFLLFVIISLLPLFSSKFFPTIDGPSHLHNANLLNHIWFQGNTGLLQYFDLNHQLNSNMVNHIWFAISALFLPSYLVEKSILIFYVIALPYSFRFLIRNVLNNPSSTKISSYLIFPFIYSFPFCIGFFNFCIGIPLLFWAIGYWLKHKEEFNTKKIIVLTCLCTLVYFTHLFNFLLLEIILFALLLREGIKNKKVKSMVTPAARLFIISLPGIILLALFTRNNNTFKHDAPRYVEKSELVKRLTDLEPIITLSKESEQVYTKTIFFVLVALLLWIIVKTIKQRKEATATPHLFWFIVAFTTLLLYFICPDWLSSGGFISIRLSLFFFILLLISIAAAALSPLELMLPIATILIVHLFFMKYHYHETQLLSNDAEEVASAEAYMEENTVVLPLNYSTNWMHINYASYLVTEKAIVNLDNYEGAKPHFPLMWKQGESVYDLMKNYGNRNPPCINIKNYETTTHHKIDYISRWLYNGDATDSCSILVANVLATDFELIYESPHKKLQLFKRKK
jgi:hypothetical protein